MNIENIKRAIEYVKTINPDSFEMNTFRMDAKDESNIHCGTSGCIVGHCTVLDAENIKRNFISSIGVILFFPWSADFFGIESDGNVWEYMFSYEWGYDDNTNTIEHAVYRMQRILDGYKPDDIGIEFEKEKEKQIS